MSVLLLFWASLPRLPAPMTLRPPPAVVATALAACLASCAGEPDAPADAPRGNLLVITIDTTRADSTSAFGCPIQTTPRLDALADVGARFTRAYAPMGQTLPTHATLFTGTNPRVHGSLENHYKLQEDAETLAETLWDEGYDTAGFVGALVLDERSGIAQGFASWGEPRGVTAKGELPPERRAEEVIDEALAWADDHEAGRPYFLWAHLFDPHGPFEAPPEYVERIPRLDVLRWIDERARAGEFGTSDEERERAQYYADEWRGYLAEILYTDAQIGRLLDGLEARGMLDDTTILVVGDHGEGLFEHGEKNHGVQLYEEVVHVPLILAHGDALAGRELDRAVPLESLRGLLESLVLGAPRSPMPVPAAPRTAQAREIWDAAATGEEVPERPVFLERPHFTPKRLLQRGFGDPTRHPYGELTAMVVGHQKLIEWPDGRRTLYDLNADPAEADDLAEARPEITRQMGAVLERWRDAHDVRAPGQGASVDAERLAALQALGYAEGDAEAEEEAAAPDESGDDDDDR